MSSMLAGCETNELLPLVRTHCRPDTLVLESGCGMGRWVKHLNERGVRAVGLEYVGETVTMVKEVWPELSIVQGDCAASPFGDASFDVVLSFGVVEHWIEGPEAPLHDVHRVLKRGGTAIVSVPCHNGVRRLKRALWWDELVGGPRKLAARVLRGRRRRLTRLDSRHRFAVYPTYGEFHEYRFTTRQFAGLVRQAGFDIVLHQPLGFLDGIYHELNPYGRVIEFEDSRFTPTRLALVLDSLMSRVPFLHTHMQVIVARKP